MPAATKLISHESLQVAQAEGNGWSESMIVGHYCDSGSS